MRHDIGKLHSLFIHEEELGAKFVEHHLLLSELHDYLDHLFADVTRLREGQRLLLQVIHALGQLLVHDEELAIFFDDFLDPREEWVVRLFHHADFLLLEQLIPVVAARQLLNGNGFATNEVDGGVV